MKRFVVCVALVGLLATPAMAGLTRLGERTGSILPASAVSMVPLDDQVSLRAATAVYDSWTAGTAGWFANAPVVGPLGYDDYGTISAVGLTKARFVGGMTRTSGLQGSAAVMWFEYYDPTTFGFITSFGVLVDAPGNYLWTITFSSPPFTIPHDGLFQAVANSTFTGSGAYSTTIAGQWFLTSSDALLVGSNNPAIGDVTTVSTTTYGQTWPAIHAFRFDVPEPATLALLGPGLLLLIRRRR